MAPFTFQWFKSGASIPGATQVSFQILAAAAADSGPYAVRVTNAHGSTVSPVVNLFVGVVPQITIQPASQTVALNGSVTFSVVAIGDPAPTYRWRRDGLVLSGATRSSLNLTGVSGLDEGAYTVEVSNGTLVPAQTTVSSPAALSVQKLVQSIAFAALPARTNHDSPFTLSATASSGLPVTYRVEGGPATVSGSTVTLTGVGAVTVRATQAGNHQYAAAAPVDQSFTVTAVRAAQSISFTSLPAKTTLDAPFTLTATASSGLPVSYSSGNPAVAIVSGSSVTLVGEGSTVITARQAGDASFLAAPEVMQSLVVNRGLRPQTINFELPPFGQLGMVPAGATVTLTASAEGGAPFTYEWRKDGTLVPGATTATLTISNFAAADAGAYAARVTNPRGSADSDVAQLKLGSPQAVVPLAWKSVGDAALSLAASATSGLPVSFTVVSGPASLSGSALTLTDAGVVTVRATQAGNADFSAAPPVERSFSVATSFPIWQASHFTAEERAGPHRSGPNAVYGLDDLPNLVKYGLGLPPKLNVSAQRPMLTHDGSRWIFTYERPEGPVLGIIQYAVEVSTDLRDPANWSGAGVVSELVNSTEGKALWRATYPLRSAANPGGTRVVAFRLRVATPEGTAHSPVLAGMTQELPVGQTTALSFPLYPAPAASFLMGRLTDAGPNFVEAASAGWNASTLSDSTQPHFVRIRSGASAGRLLPLLGAAGAENRLLVDAGGLSLTRSGVTTGPDGDAFEVLAARTLAGAFSGVSLTGGSTAAEADQVQVWSGASWISFYRHAPRNRWEAEHDPEGAPARDAYALRPDRGLRVRRGNAGPQLLYVHHAGRVPDTAVRIVHDRPGSTFVALGLPVDVTLAGLEPGLGGGVAGGWRTGVSPASATTSADLLMVWNPAGNRWNVNYKNSGSARWEEARDAAQAVRDETVIPAGQPLLIRRVGDAGAQILALPLPYSVAR
jgi:hypothetical protein